MNQKSINLENSNLTSESDDFIFIGEKDQLPLHTELINR